MKFISTAFLVICILILSYLVVGIGTVMKNGTSITDNPGTLNRLKLFFSINTASTSENSQFPELKPRHYQLKDEETIQSFSKKVVQRAESLGYVYSEQSSDDQTLHFTITTQLFKFVDDLKITIEQDEKSETQSVIVNAHSSSRTGRADFGANIANIKKFFASLD